MIRYNINEQKVIIILAVFLAAIRAVVSWAVADPGEPVSPPGRQQTECQTDTARPLNLNQATAFELGRVPGVASHLAQRIVRYRQLYGHFSSFADLKAVEEVADDCLECITQHTFIAACAARMVTETSPYPGKAETVCVVNINLAGEKEFCALPGIGIQLARRIIEFREKHGEFHKIESLTAVPGIGSERYKKISGSLEVNAADTEPPAARQPVRPCASTAGKLVN